MGKPRKLRTVEDRRKLTLRQGELTALAQHPSWPVLEAVADERREKYIRDAARDLLYGGMSPERQAYIRGFMKGMEYLLVIPGNAEARLEEWLREQEVASGSE